MRQRLADLRTGMPVLGLLVRRDVKVRYADSVLGWLWSFLDPLLMSLVFYLVFTVIFQRDVGEDPYILFLITGLLAWTWTSKALGDAPRALTKDKQLVGAVRLPREVWALRTVFSRGTEYVFALPVVVLFAVVFAHPPSLYLLALPLAFLIQAVLLVGLSLLLSPVGVLVTDSTNIVGLVTRLGFYGSPIFYGLADVPEAVRPWYVLNPMAGIIDLYRAAWFPEAFSGWGPVGVSAAVAVVALVAGSVVFARLERPALKEL
ncbi:ABC transporter permease [Pseudokineococcus marinus]|uniref:Transport permease protein n=1 Tax=Pseudokineococcus marinus TaxID=351215 RepID=A0A849BMU7_9ACTN|nr:ABC transporter permease [Pseudokineococcus marinus]NNH23981.1 ABC transporter permease [Pseudokineococcus marinus]